MAEQKRSQTSHPSNLYFKALDVPEGKAQDEVMARRGAKLGTLCRSAEALLRVAKTLRDSDRLGLVEDQLPLMMAAVAEVQERADALTMDMKLVASNWRCRPEAEAGGFVPARGGWIPPVPMPPVPPDGLVPPVERFGSIVIKRDVLLGGVTPADFAASINDARRKAGGLA